MLRRFFLILIRRAFLILLLICLGCVAQSAPPDVARKIERRVRSYYNLPPEVQIVVGDITAGSDWPNYDSVSVTVKSTDSKKDFKFLISKDRNTMVRMVK